MLRRLRYTNFKSWPQVDLEFGNITGLFGTNSSGKTSVLQFLLLLKQTKETTDRAISLDLNGPYVSLGAYGDMVYGHDENRELDWELSIARSEPLTLQDPSERRSKVFVQSNSINVRNKVISRDGAPKATYLSYTVTTKGGYVSFGLRPKEPSDASYDLFSEGGEFRFVRTSGRPWQLPGPIKGYAFPDQARTYFQNASFLSDLEAAFEEQIDQIYYLGPLREYPQRDYLWARSRPHDVGLRGERAIDAILAATVAGETRNLRRKAHYKSFQEMVAYWLSEMGLIEAFRVEEIARGSNRWQAKVRVRKGGTEALLTDVGFGVSQVLPVLTLLYYVPERSTVILEQPEIHLHPLAQAHLADVIINVSEHRQVQIILESHSEHLLLRLQRRVAEEMISAENVKLYFCDAAQGTSTLSPLGLDMFGNIRNWPKNFMGDAFGEAFAAEEARLKRMAAAE